MKLPAKKQRFRGPNQKRPTTDGQQMLLRAIIDHYGGPFVLANFLQQETGITAFHKQNLINWRNRRGVPLEFVNRLALALNLNEYALNYKDMAVFKGVAPPWRDVVLSCRFLGEEKLEEILDCDDPQF